MAQAGIKTMSCNPRKFREPVRLIVSVEAVTVNAIDDFYVSLREGLDGFILVIREGL